MRELENAVQRALVMAKSDAILLENLPPEVLNVANAASPDVDGDDEKPDWAEAVWVGA